jgi:hypothetical protein
MNLFHVDGAAFVTLDLWFILLELEKDSQPFKI